MSPMSLSVLDAETLQHYAETAGQPQSHGERAERQMLLLAVALISLSLGAYLLF